MMKMPLMLGGISGNAGTFGTADDLFKLLSLFQNFGAHGGKQLLSKAVVEEFSTIQYPENENRRGLGFDKPLIGNDTLALKDAYPAPSASPKSFGHSGFTGTFVWADPEHQLTFIFLSNRVYPTRENRNLYELNIRPKLHQLFYEAYVDKNSTDELGKFWLFLAQSIRLWAYSFSTPLFLYSFRFSAPF